VGLTQIIYNICDDTLIFCGADLDYLHHLRCLFLCFEVVSGLNINLAKSGLVSGGNVDNIDGLVGILGCGGFFSAFEVSWPTVGGLL
jgi:hypothetical protein